MTDTSSMPTAEAASRYFTKKRAANFLAMLKLAAAHLWLSDLMAHAYQPEPIRKNMAIVDSG